MRKPAGAKLLEKFLKSRGVKIVVAAKALGVSHPALIGWLKGKAVPTLPNRAAIAEWTRGEVPASSWGPSEFRHVEPYDPDRAPASERVPSGAPPTPPTPTGTDGN